MDDPDDTPTQPPPPEAFAIALSQWLAETDLEAKEMEDLVRAYASMSTEQRVLFRALARELAPKG